MRRFLSLFLLVTLPAVAEAQTTPLRVTSDVANAEIVVRGVEGAHSGPAPLLLEDLVPGFYDVYLYREGRRLSQAQLVVDQRSVGRKGTRGSRTILSAMVPGMGQWRDFRTRDAAVPLVSVGLTGIRALQFHSQRGQASQELDAWLAIGPEDRTFPDAVPYDDNGTEDTGDDTEAIPANAALRYAKITADLEDGVWLEEQTRNDYLMLAGVLHAGNILTANVARGSYRMDLSSSNSLAARYRPPSKATVLGLSALWPGLGQTRAGHSTRGLVWNAASAIAGMYIVEAIRDRDEEQVRVWTLDRQIEVEEDELGAPASGTLAQQALAVRDLESARQKRNGFLIGAGVLWALNVLDAFLIGDTEPVERVTGQASTGWTTQVATVGGAPGLVLSRRF